MEIHQLRYFARVAELGNFTRAAEACHVSQPSLSQQIAKLERELGQPLFERRGRGAKLTDAGRQLKERVDQILNLVDEARASVADDAEVGRLVVGAIPTVAPFLLPPILMQFTAACPHARVELVEETTPPLVKRLLEGEVDLAVLCLPVHSANLHIEILFSEELLAVLSAAHPLAKKPRLSLRDLAAERLVLLHETHCLTSATLSFCTREALSPLVTAQIYQLATVQELVRLGHGVSLAPAMAAEADGNPGRVYRSLTGDPPTRTLAMVWNRMRYQSQLFKLFCGFVRDAAGAK